MGRKANLPHDRSDAERLSRTAAGNLGRAKDLILDSAAEMVAYYDTELRVVWANRASAESVGLTSQELIGRHCYEIWQNRTTPCPGCPVLLSRDEKTPQGAEHRSPNGRFWSLRGYPVVDDSGAVVGLVEFGWDITDEKRGEAERAKLEEQFHQAQKLESVGRLAGGVAHDLNNLLAPILGYSEILLEDEEEAGDRRDFLQEIVKASVRARDLVRQLLAFSRKQTLEFKPVDLNRLLRDFEKLLRRTVREDIELNIVTAEPLPCTHGDVGQLEQLVMNLVVNAQDAMPDGGSLTIETSEVGVNSDVEAESRDLAPGPYVGLKVRDTGCGIGDEIVEHLFEPFFTTKSREKGTGLGLATVYGIAKQHGGNVYVQTEPGAGSEFEILLPAITDVAVSQDGVPETLPPVGGSETILLVEDNEQVRDLSLSVLERQGYAVLVAKNGREAESIATRYSGTIDLLLTDVIMPYMDGKHLYERISAKHPEVKALYMSGYADDTVSEHGVGDVPFHFIQKPFSVNALTSRIRSVLDHAGRMD